VLAAVGLIAASTFVIASSMMGVLAILTGSAPGFGERVPYYVLGAAGVFTAVVVLLEMRIDEGITIISTSLAVAAVALLAIGFGTEGLLFGFSEPDRMLSNLFVYLLAAGLISTGVIFWAVRHWREFASTHEIV